jgi:hypothetical protein
MPGIKQGRGMVREGLIVLLAVASLLPGAAGAQTSPTSADLEIGIRHVREGELEQAVITLDAVTRRLSADGGPAADLSRAYAYLAIAYMGLAQQEKAKQRFIDAWKANQELILSAHEFPPAVIEMFEQARREEEERAAQPTPAPSRAHGGGRRTTLLLAGGAVASAGAGVALLAGDPSPRPRPTPRVDLLDNTAMGGNSQQVISGLADVARCQSSCLAYSWCRAFVVTKPPFDPACFLKDALFPISPHTCCILGIVNRP